MVFFKTLKIFDTFSRFFKIKLQFFTFSAREADFLVIFPTFFNLRLLLELLQIFIEFAKIPLHWRNLVKFR